MEWRVKCLMLFECATSFKWRRFLKEPYKWMSCLMVRWFSIYWLPVSRILLPKWHLLFLKFFLSSRNYSQSVCLSVCLNLTNNRPTVQWTNWRWSDKSRQVLSSPRWEFFSILMRIIFLSWNIILILNQLP